MADTLITDQTRVTSTPPPSTVPTERTRTIGELVAHAGHLRNMTRMLGEDVEQVHREAFEVQLETKARELTKRAAADLLNELADQGFAWRDIARLIGVSVPAVRRWRLAESPTPAHLLAIAKLLAFVEIVRDDHMVVDVAAWMEVPISAEAPVTAMDLAAAGRFGDLLELAALHVSAEYVLDRWQPDWRERYRSEFEVFEAPDGELGIRPIPASD